MFKKSRMNEHNNRSNWKAVVPRCKLFNNLVNTKFYKPMTSNSYVSALLFSVVIFFFYFLLGKKCAGSVIAKKPRANSSSLQQQELCAFEAQGFKFHPPTSAVSLETKAVLQCTPLDLVLSFTLRKWLMH